MQLCKLRWPPFNGQRSVRQRLARDPTRLRGGANLAPGSPGATKRQASLTFAHPDSDLDNRVEEAGLELLTTHPRVMRDLSRRLAWPGR
jgi:hypothetical protein